MRKFVFVISIITTLLLSAPLHIQSEPGGIALKEVKKEKLAPGIIYRNVLIGNKDLKLCVHVIEIDITKKNNKLCLIKGMDNAGEREKLHHMMKRFDSLSNYKAVGGINGSFWAYLYNYPIGPTVIDGEVVEMSQYRNWSSAFMDENGRMYIDRFDINGMMKLKNRKKLKISYVNRRMSNRGIVLYNSFAGDSVPYINSSFVYRAFKQAMEDSLYSDITDKEFDTLEFKGMLRYMERDSSLELPMTKVSAIYLNDPAVNREIKLKVVSVDTGIVPVPENGCVISYGENISRKLIPKKGDKISLTYTTNILRKKVFKNSISGTPRLVRKGRSKHEAAVEGVKSRRFIETEFPRAAIGTTKDKKKIFLVTIMATNRSKGKKGAHLVNLAYAMRRIGAWDAMNLDGGGSAIMVINNKNIMWESDPARSRSLTIGVVAGVKKEEYKKFVKKNGK